MFKLNVTKVDASINTSEREHVHRVERYLFDAREINFTECLCYIDTWKFNSCDLNSYELSVPSFNFYEKGGNPFIVLGSCFMQHGFNLSSWPGGIDPISQFLKWQTFKRIKWSITKQASNEAETPYVMSCNGVNFCDKNLFYLIVTGFEYLNSMSHEEFTTGVEK